MEVALVVLGLHTVKKLLNIISQKKTIPFLYLSFLVLHILPTWPNPHLSTVPLPPTSMRY